MSEATCSVLAAVFPIVMLAVVVERRSVHLNIRRMVWFRQALAATFSLAIIGLGAAVLGVQLGGLDGGWAFVAWAVAAVSLGGLTLTLLASLATAEVEEDDDDPSAIAESS